jgi:hypothetical protein
LEWEDGLFDYGLHAELIVEGAGVADIIATFNATTGWTGRTIVYQGDGLVLEGYGPVTAANLLEYDRLGQVDWAREGLREWAQQRESYDLAASAGTSAATSGAGSADGQAVGMPTRETDSLVSPLLDHFGPLCPVCRSQAMHETDVKAFLHVKRELVCGTCGSVFVEHGKDPELFQLDRTTQTSLPAWGTYAHKKLSAREWQTIAQGGLSDEEQSDADLAGAMQALREGKVDAQTSADAPILLKGGEGVIFCIPDVTLREPRSVTTGGYGGPSVHVAKGITLRVGAFRAQSHEELKDVDSGTLVLTTKRLVFAGALRSPEIALAKLISVDAYSDAVAIRRTGKERTEIFFGLDRHRYEFVIEGRSYTEPFSGLILKYAIEGQVNPPTS